MDDAGNFIITWQSYEQDGDNAGVYAQRYNAAGVAQGSEFLVNTTTTGYQGSPIVIMDADGDFAVIWSAQEEDSSLGTYFQRFNAVQGTACQSLAGGECHAQGMQYPELFHLLPRWSAVQLPGIHRRRF